MNAQKTADEAAAEDFNNLMNVFIQNPNDINLNEEIYNELDNLQNLIGQIHVTREERYALNSIVADIKVVKDFMAPISNKFNSHLSVNNISRLSNIFGNLLTTRKLNVKCPSNEIEFIELRLSSLIICYLHCISNKVENGVRVKFYARSGNQQSNGEYGAMKNEYTPIIHNVGKSYATIRSATITKRF